MRASFLVDGTSTRLTKVCIAASFSTSRFLQNRRSFASDIGVTFVELRFRDRKRRHDFASVSAVCGPTFEQPLRDDGSEKQVRRPKQKVYEQVIHLRLRDSSTGKSVKDFANALSENLSHSVKCNVRSLFPANRDRDASVSPVRPICPSR